MAKLVVSWMENQTAGNLVEHLDLLKDTSLEESLADNLAVVKESRLVVHLALKMVEYLVLMTVGQWALH